MTDDWRQQPEDARRIAFPKLAIVAVIIAGAALTSACSQPSDSQQTAQQQASDEQARKEADEKAWADAEKAGTIAAYTAYLQNFGSGAHVSEASQRIVALNETTRTRGTISISSSGHLVATLVEQQCNPAQITL